MEREEVTYYYYYFILFFLYQFPKFLFFFVKDPSSLAPKKPEVKPKVKKTGIFEEIK